MIVRFRERTREALRSYPRLLARLGLVDRQKGTEAFDLAVPMMVTGGIRTLIRTLDFFMVSIALGGAAVAGLEFGFQFYFIGFGLALAISSGTISTVSRLKGAGDHERANLAIKQSLWVALLITLPLTAATWVGSDALVGLLTDDAAAIEYGATYLRLVMLAMTFRFWSLIASRALAGSGNTVTPMLVRLVTIPINAVLNAVLIFGLLGFRSFGIAGAAWGTVIANILAGVVFFALLLSGRYDVRLPIRGQQWDTKLAVEIVRVGLPLAGTRLVQTVGRFPFLFILGTLGTPVVAAYAIGRRVMLLAMMPAWGFSTASSTLVGQSLGAGHEEQGEAYGWQTLRISVITQLSIAAVLVVAARPIVELFDAEAVDTTVNFVRTLGIGAAGFGISRTMRGGLRGAGDMHWPFYGTVLGTVIRLGFSALALPTTALAFTAGGLVVSPGIGLGVGVIYVAILIDLYARAAVNTYRFRSGRWKEVAERAGLGTGSN